MSEHQEPFAALVQRVASGELSRRAFIRRAIGLGVSASTLAGALAETALATPAPSGRTDATRFQADANTLVIADDLKDNWITLDPGRIYEVDSQAAEVMVYETLYFIPDGTKPTDIQPLLADGMPEFSADGKTATIKLHKGVKFHNSGNEMTSADLIFSWNRCKNIKFQGAFLVTDYWTKVEAVDEYTIKLTLAAPNAALLGILTTAPTSVTDSKTVKAHGGTDAADADQTDNFTTWHDANTSVGTGPYVMKSFDINTEVQLEAFADYWGDKPKLDRIIFRNIVKPTEQTQAVQTGEADVAYAIDPDQIDSVKSDPNLQLITGATLLIDYIAMHTQPDPGGPLAKKEVRQAVASAIDYDGIINDLMKGAGVRPATIVPLGLLGADQVESMKYVKDLTKAQQLFDSAGTGDIELTFTYGAGASSSGNIPLDTLAAKLQSDIQQIKGIKVKLNPMDPAQRLEQYRASKLQFTFSGWSPDFPDVSSYSDPFGKSDGSAAKRVGFKDPSLDKVLDQALAELDVQKRTDLYVQAEKTLVDAAAFIVIDQPNAIMPANKSVQGVTPHPTYVIQLRYASKTA